MLVICLRRSDYLGLACFPFIYDKNLRNMKLNYLYCLLAFLFMPLCIKAQDVKYLKYQGEVNTSFSFSIDEETCNLNLEVINGVRFSRYFFAAPA